MSIISTWTTLRTSAMSESPEVVLCADFQTTGRPEAGFPELVSQLRLDADYWLIAPAAVAPDADITIEEYMDSWLAPVRESGLTVRAVLGFCVGGVYATALTEGVAKFQETAPTLVLLDPEQTELRTIQYQLSKVTGMLNTVLSESDIAQIHAKLGELAAVDGMTVRRYAREMFAGFRVFTNGAFERAGLDPAYGEEMLELFSTFLTYLSIADDLDPRPAWACAPAISSTSPESGLNRIRATGAMGTDELVAREITFAEDHTELLRSAGVAETVDKLLER